MFYSYLDPKVRYAIDKLVEVYELKAADEENWLRMLSVLNAMNRDKTRPAIQRGDAYMQFAQRGIQLEWKPAHYNKQGLKKYARDNNTWAALSRIALKESPQLARKLSPRHGVYDEVIKAYEQGKTIEGVPSKKDEILRRELTKSEDERHQEVCENIAKSLKRIQDKYDEDDSAAMACVRL